MPKLTQQEQQPHESLVQVRNAIQSSLECPRKEAALIANELTHDQCEKVVAADADKAKVEAAIKNVKPKLEPAKTGESKTATNKKG